MGRYGDLVLPVLFFLVCFSFFFVYGLAASQLSQNQTEIMQELSRSLPISSVANGKWNTTDPNPCKWDGVTCSPGPNSQVTYLTLSGLGLDDSAAPVLDLLCRLDPLESLNLSQNALSSIPNSFLSNCSGLSRLKALNLSSNKLNGPLNNLSGFGDLLEFLDLSYNPLNGTVDSQLDRLAKLKSLNLSANRFTGGIPIVKAPGLEVLVLSANLFRGRIPTEVFDYRNLTVLDLSQNQLSGPVPDEIVKLSRLGTLLLSSNNLSGVIPAILSNIRTLSWFAASQNNFGGSIPRGITANMRTLDLSYNNLSGEIPSDLLSSPTLESVDLSNNLLRGPIPGDSSPSQRLYRLRLSGNSLNGSIPNAIVQLPGLVYLELDRNELGSEIPPQLENCKNLTLLNLASNRLSGSLPKVLGSLQKLQVLQLQMNTLGGEIPDEAFKLGNLNILNLSQNLLTGVISPAISSLRNLTNLNLQGNQLHGPIPATISSLASLRELQLGNNRLSGTVPRMPGTLAIALNLSSNLFSGPIPSYLGDLTQLEILDLSNNSFSGEVPTSLAKMSSLTLLVLSYNQLSGVLPDFPKFVTVNATGNKALEYGAVVIGSSPTTSSKRKKSTVVTIIVVVICAVTGLGLVAAALAFMLSKRFYRVEDEGLQIGETAPQIIHGSFITANSIHRSSIDFTKTVDAVGDPNNIILKTRFSTYYKAVMPSGVSYSVKKLNWSDKIFQMGSHERFGQELEVLGRLSNSNLMVPLAYVLTEDSAYLFYENVHQGTVFDFLHKGPENVLDWPSRYSIALGVAQGLTFLQGCTQPVLLLDLSTKSVHLKSLKEPQIGDIELCKVIDPSKSTGSLSTVAGSVGYIPPEYAYTMRVTMAGNVYSFGVILLELLTGKPPVSNGLELAKWALSCSSPVDKREQILDSMVCKTSLAVRSQMLSVLKVALACVSIAPEARPKMRNVLSMLFNAR